jgi:hypothetical protein
MEEAIRMHQHSPNCGGPIRFNIVIMYDVLGIFSAGYMSAPSYFGIAMVVNFNNTKSDMASR